MLDEVFRQHIGAKRSFMAIAEACSIKGWPDRAAAVRTAFRLQQPLCDQELMRFEHLVAVHDAGGNAEKPFSSIESISEAIYDKWTAVDDGSLEQRNPAYTSVRAEISRCRAAIDQEAIHEPLLSAQRDPECLRAREILRERLRDCDKELASPGSHALKGKM